MLICEQSLAPPRHRRAKSGRRAYRLAAALSGYDDADSRLSTRTLANGVVASHGYDAANNITTLAYVNSTGTTLASFSNTYNAANMRTSTTDLAGNITTLTYDGAYQVASQTGGGSATLGWADMTVSQWANLTVDQWATLPVDGSEILQTNQYDNSGNALVMVTAAGTATNSYDPANRLTSSISPLGTTTLTYDGRNRRTGIQTPDGGITTYTWTDDNQLAAVALPNGGGTITNTYNGDGLRFSRTDANGTNSYLWNSQVLEAQLGAGNTVSTWYTQGMGEYGNIISTRDASAGASSLQLYDASGNVNQATDAGANITATLSYDSFGNVTDNSGPANPIVAWQGKQGYQFEQALGVAGLQYVRQRWYDPATRQFISPDPLGFAGATVPWGIESGQVSGGDVNLFRYAGNNPINMNDPGGEQFGDNSGQVGGGFSFLGPLVPSAPLQNTLGVQPSRAVQRAVIAHMPTRTAAERLAKDEALRSLNAPINVASLGHLAAALVGFPFALAYEGGKSSYRHAVANTTILATRHIEHGGSTIGAGTEAVAYNILSWSGIKSILEGGAGTTLVHPQRLSTGERFLKVGSGALQFVIVAAPEIKEFLPGIGGAAPADAVAARSFSLGGQDYEQLRESLRSVFGTQRGSRVGENLAEGTQVAQSWWYPATGHHAIFPERWKIVPEWIRGGRLNVIRPFEDPTEYAEWHFRVDPKYFGGRFKDAARNLVKWSGQREGLLKYGMAGRLWYGSPRWLFWGTGSLAGISLGLLGYDEAHDPGMWPLWWYMPRLTPPAPATSVRP